MKKQFRVIDASISKERAVEVLGQHGLYAELYRVPQGDDKELAESMRLLSGLGYIVKNTRTEETVGSFDRIEKCGNQLIIHSAPRIGMSVLSKNVITVHFPKSDKNKFSLKDAVKER